MLAHAGMADKPTQDSVARVFRSASVMRRTSCLADISDDGRCVLAGDRGMHVCSGPPV